MNHLKQYSNSQNLVNGDYNSHTNIKNLLESFDFGLGTCESLDGEFLVKDRIAIHLKPDGTGDVISQEMGVSYCVMTNFTPDWSKRTDCNLSLVEFYQIIENQYQNTSLPIIIMFEGEISSIKLRSMTKQSLPYKPLSLIMPTLTLNDHNTTHGSIIGFYFPEASSKLNCPGYHLHYISRDNSIAGHIMDCVFGPGEIKTAMCTGHTA